MTKTKQLKQRKQYLLIGIGTGALLGGGYLAYTFLKNRAASQRGDVIINQPVTQIRELVAQHRGDFPLSKGAKGSLVRMLQAALLALGGKPAEAIRQTSIRPDGTPDGVFGAGTARALLAASLPAVVTESTFNRLIAKGKSSSQVEFDSKAIAEAIKGGAEKLNIFTVLNGLAKIRDVAGYQAVSSYFNNIRVRGTRVTSLVNALLSVAFANNEAAKVKVRAEFERMGLVNRDGRWSLSGLEKVGHPANDLFKLAVTRKPTLLKAGNGTYRIPVVQPWKVVGYVTGRKAGVIQVYTPQGQIVYAPGKNLKLV